MSLRRFENDRVIDSALWWHVSGLPDTRQITAGAPGLWCLRVHSPACCNDVWTVIINLSVRHLWIHPPSPVLLLLLLPNNREPVSGRARLRRVGSRKDMGERAEPMQWVLARHRQNSGEQLPPDEETDNLTDYLPFSCAHMQGSRPAAARTVWPGFLVHL